MTYTFRDVATRIAHAGLGKTATTSLKRVVFPALAEHLGVPYHACYTHEPLRRLRAEMDLHLPSTVRPHEFPEEFVLCCEALVGWDPYWWETYADTVAEALGSHTTVLLTVRPPRVWLTSVYVQRCLHQGDVLTPEEFFLTADTYSPYLATPAFDVESFGYARLVDTYRARFARVVVVPMERIPSLAFLSELADVTGLDTEGLRRELEGVRANRAYSARSVRWTFALERLLQKLGLTLSGSRAADAREHLEVLRVHAASAGRAPDPAGEAHRRSLRQRVTGHLLTELRWRHLVQQRLDHWLPYARYALDFGALPWIPIGALEEEYARLFG